MALSTAFHIGYTVFEVLISGVGRIVAMATVARVRLEIVRGRMADGAAAFLGGVAVSERE